MRRVGRRVRDRIAKATGVTVVPNEVYAKHTRTKGRLRTAEILTRCIRDDDITVLDVGAHRGESIDFYHDTFPRSRVISFEPDPGLAAELRRVYDPALVHAVALSNAAGRATFYRSRSTVMSSLEPFSAALASTHAPEPVEVPVIRGDDWLQENGIGRIGVLKINVQGHEDRVLEGFSSTLEQELIDAVVVEINCGDRYSRPVTIYAVERWLVPHAYMLVDIPLIKVGGRSRKIQMMHSIYVRRSIWESLQDA